MSCVCVQVHFSALISAASSLTDPGWHLPFISPKTQSLKMSQYLFISKTGNVALSTACRRQRRLLSNCLMLWWWRTTGNIRTRLTGGRSLFCVQLVGWPMQLSRGSWLSEMTWKLLSSSCDNSWVGQLAGKTGEGNKLTASCCIFIVPWNQQRCNKKIQTQTSNQRLRGFREKSKSASMAGWKTCRITK